MDEPLDLRGSDEDDELLECDGCKRYVPDDQIAVSPDVGIVLCHECRALSANWEKLNC